jgi:molecular chaperone GrpE
MEQHAENAGNEVQSHENQPDGEELQVSESKSQDLLKEQYDDLNNRYLRLAADFENFRKRTERDIGTRTAFAIEGFARDMLEVSDNFERALRDETDERREGMSKIAKLFESILERHGICQVRSEGMMFNPAEHEAMAAVPSDTPEGTIIEEVVRGYSLHGKIIRCAKVVVSRGTKEV